MDEYKGKHAEENRRFDIVFKKAHKLISLKLYSQAYRVICRHRILHPTGLGSDWNERLKKGLPANEKKSFLRLYEFKESPYSVGTTIVSIMSGCSIFDAVRLHKKHFVYTDEAALENEIRYTHVSKQLKEKDNAQIRNTKII